MKTSLEDIFEAREVKAHHYSFQNRFNFDEYFDRVYIYLRELGKYFGDFSSVTILDVGCGSGRLLHDFLGLGFKAENMSGIDPLSERISEAKDLLPSAVDLRCEQLTADSDKQYDVVICNTVISLVDPIERELFLDFLKGRMKPYGILLIYDMTIWSPFNKHVKRVKPGQILASFEAYDAKMISLTPLPLIARRLASSSEFAYHLLKNFLPKASKLFIIKRGR